MPDLNNQLKNKVLSSLDWSLSEMNPVKDKFRQYYYNFRSEYYSESEIKKYPDKYFVPITFEIITYLATVLSTYNFNLNILSSPLKNDDQIDKLADYLENWGKHQFYVQRMREKLTELIYDSLIYGSSIYYMFYSFKKRKPFEKDLGGKKIILSTDVEYDDPDGEVLSLFDNFYPDPEATTIDNAKYLIRLSIVSVDDIYNFIKSSDWDNKGNYYQPNLDELGNARDEFIYRSRGVFGKLDSPIMTALKQNNQKHLWIEYWEDNQLLISIDENILIRWGDNPYQMKKKPFIKLDDIEIPHEFWGIGEAEIVKDYQSIANDFMRLALQNMKLCSQKRWASLVGSNFNPNVLLTGKSNYIEVESMDAFQEIVFTPVYQNALNAVENAKNDAYRSTGIMDLFINLRMSDSATETNIGHQQTTHKIMKKIRSINKFIERWLWMSQQLAAQFYGLEKMIITRNDEGLSFLNMPIDVLSNGMLMIESATIEPLTFEEAVLRANSLIASFKNDPNVNQRKLTKIALDNIDPINANKLFLSDQELEQRIQTEEEEKEKQKEEAFEAEAAKLELEKQKNRIG